MPRPEDWIRVLDLAPHPEGGYYRETHRAADRFSGEALAERFQGSIQGSRACSTAIYYLLVDPQISRLHRIAQDEVWHFYAGDGLLVPYFAPDGTSSVLRLGTDLDRGETPQGVVPAGCWFGAMLPRPGTYALVGCTVAPGFEFSDLEFGRRALLTARFPQHRSLIERLTYPD
ncbi:MAG: cupin domain-containing protein [Deltaproteobacteria bacterium]|nr:cupin domain-containing protein [Deltaproteobacteria bacterium]